LGLNGPGGEIEAAVLEAVRQKKTTADVGGNLGTTACAERIANKVG
jgi:hypothetical protein